MSTRGNTTKLSGTTLCGAYLSETFCGNLMLTSRSDFLPGIVDIGQHNQSLHQIHWVQAYNLEVSALSYSNQVMSCFARMGVGLLYKSWELRMHPWGSFCDAAIVRGFIQDGF